VHFFLEHAWVIAAIPLVTSFVIAIFARRLGERSGWIGSATMLAALVWSVFVLLEAIKHAGHGGPEIRFFATPVWELIWYGWSPWGAVSIDLGLQVDGLTAIMLVVVTAVSWAVQHYSIEYMHGDRRVPRYFAAINLFTLGMLGLVLSDNLFTLLISWEIMGLCSYLLIGHWFEQEGPQLASIKAFLTTRVGDVGMMVGIFILFGLTGTFRYEEISLVLEAGGVNPLWLGLGAFLLFTGAMGKSAQFPLHTWLPDAMAGPTPGSALIHAATMVAAGVYLVARSYVIFLSAPPWVLGVVALVGGFTALFAASIATLRTDIKQVLAYSTVSQLGYMIMALGVGGYYAAAFHLMTHAFFKALLFLCSGAVIHAVHTQEMHQMGGLRKKLPVTYYTWMVGYLALAGFPFLSGWISKDALLVAAWNWTAPAGWPAWVAFLPFAMGLVTALLTAYYMTRATILTFFGRPRDHHAYEHAHDPQWPMKLPLIALAVPAAISGYVWAHYPHIEWLPHFLATPGIGLNEAGAGTVLVIATTTGILGILIGWLIYRTADTGFREAAIRALEPVYTLVKNKYYVDELYSFVFVSGTLRFSELISWFDRTIVDGIVNFVGTAGVWLSEIHAWFDTHVIDYMVNIWADMARAVAAVLRRLTTGYVQQYMLTVVVVVVAAVILFQVF
jgi:NADH-quinone oxidoreductase subunit L